MFHMKKKTTAMIFAALLPALMPNASLAATVTRAAATWPYPGPAYSPVSMWIGMIALMAGLIIPLWRLMRDVLRRKK